MSTILKKVLLSGLNRFTALVVAALAEQANLDAAQTKGFRNLLRDAARNGGKRTPGYYQGLPTGKGGEVAVTQAQIDGAYTRCITVLKALIPALAGAGEAEATYSYTDKATKAQMVEPVTFDCSAMELPNDDTLASWVETAKAGGGSSNTFLASLDF